MRKEWADHQVRPGLHVFSAPAGSSAGPDHRMPRAPETRGREFGWLVAGWPARGIELREVAFEPACQCRGLLILAHEREVEPKAGPSGQVLLEWTALPFGEEIVEQDLDKLAISLARAY